MNFVTNDTDDKDAARAAAKLSGKNLGSLVVSLWNDAHNDYTKLRTSFDRVEEVYQCDGTWTEWKSKRPPDPKSEAAYILAGQVKSFYTDALIKRAENEAARQAALSEGRSRFAAEVATAEARVNWANETLPPFWTVGTQLGGLAAKVAATRPTSIYMDLPSMMNAPKIKRPANEMVAPVADADTLLAHIDALESDVAEISKALKAMRANIVSRGK